MEEGHRVGMDPYIVDRARAGDRDAYEHLAQTTADRLYPVAWRMLRDRDLADEAVQKTLVAIWSELPKLRDSARFEAWTYRMLVRFCGEEIKRQRRYGGDVYELNIGGRPVEGTTQVARRDELSRAFQRLSAEHRAVVVLVFYGGLTAAEAAESLEISPGTVSSRLHYALRTLRAAVEADRRPGGGAER